MQILAQLGTASAQWAIAVMECEGGPICLARVILKRADLVKIAKDAHEKSLRGQGTALDKEEGGKVTRASTNETEISEEELLCYALALFTTSALAGKSFAFKIAHTSEQNDFKLRFGYQLINLKMKVFKVTVLVYMLVCVTAAVPQPFHWDCTSRSCITSISIAAMMCVTSSQLWDEWH